MIFIYQEKRGSPLKDESKPEQKTQQPLKIIDAHAHVFPEKIAEKAVTSIGEFYDIPMRGNGTSEMLLKSGATIGVEKYLVCSTATKPQQVEPINDFIYGECQKHQEFVGFATLHPFMDHLEQEIERIQSLGFKGIKLHPDFQLFHIDDERAMEIYKRVEGKLMILFHTGDARYDYSRPTRLARVCDKFPDLKCIAAHFGGYQNWDEAYEVYDSKNIFMDTSSSLYQLTPEQALKIMDKFGMSQFFFGTDFPMWSHQQELERLLNLQLKKEDLEAVLYWNFYNYVLNEYS